MTTEKYKKPKVITYTRRGKVRKKIICTLTARSKKVKTLSDELKKQRSKAQIIPKGTNRKGRMATWKRGGEFPANRPRAGWYGRARWTKGNDWSNDSDAGRVYHYQKDDN